VLEIACHAIDNQTGVRESVLSAACSKDKPKEMLAYPGQAFFDDREHDRMFPQHALSRVRAAQAWLTNEAGLTVTNPPTPFTRTELMLSEAACCITPPPRFLQLRQRALGMTDTLVNFSRVCLSVLDDQQLMFGVWHLSNAPIGVRDQTALSSLAKETTAGWARQGAKTVQSEVRELPAADTFTEVECVVNLVVEDRDYVEVQRWISDTAGSVWRLGIGGARPLLDLKETRTLLAQARASFRPVSRPTRSQRKKRPWWKFGASW